MPTAPGRADGEARQSAVCSEAGDSPPPPGAPARKEDEEQLPLGRHCWAKSWLNLPAPRFSNPPAPCARGQLTHLPAGSTGSGVPCSMLLSVEAAGGGEERGEESRPARHPAHR